MGRGYQCRRVRPYPCSALGVDQVSLDVYLTCPCCEETVYDANITHNLGKVAAKAGIYQALWRPDELGITNADQLVPILTRGLEYLYTNTEELRALEPSNGWGTVEDLISFVSYYLSAAESNPNATIEVSR